MGDASDDEDSYHYFGTPIEIESESKAGQYRKGPQKDPAATRHLPVHQQEVTDAQGRRRFHGAFTGGFSAGYFNTVGTKEGWAPASFKSSRSEKNRQTAQPQNIEQFLDEDELEELRKIKLQTSTTYDTFGDTAAETARRAALEEARQRPSVIPGLLPEEAVVPVAEGIGIQLLQRMGWRQGKGIGTAGPSRQKESARGFGQIAGVGPENTPLHLIKPKHDVHGLGYDPFKGAEEFRRAQEERREASGPRGSRGVGVGAKRHRGVAFGTGVLDEDDSYDILEDYVTHDGVESYEEVAGMDAEGMPLGRGPKVDRKFLGDRLALQGFAYEVQDEEESDEDAPGGSIRAQKPLQLTGPAVPLALQSAEHARRKGLIPGFVLATEDGGIQRPEYYPPPEIPADYVPVHRPAPKPAAEAGIAGAAPPRAPTFAMPPPANPSLRQEIERLAFFVAKNGPSFEALAREQQIKAGGANGAPMFLLPGGEGAAFYQWKLATLRALLAPKGKNAAVQSVLKPIGQRSAPLSAEDRGALLGEQPLPSVGGASQEQQQQQQQASVPLARSLLQVAEEDRHRLAAAMGSTFVRAEKQEMLQPEQPIAGLQPGLRPGAPREPPKKEQEAAAGAAAAPPQQRGIVTVQDLSRPLADTFGGGTGTDTAAQGASAPLLPVRKTEEWRPEPLLCKRLDVPDPYKGRPKELQMSRFRTDHIALPATAEAMGRAAAKAAPAAPEFLLPPSVKVAAEEAAAAAQLAAAAAAEKLPDESEEAVNASNAAEAFLNSLFDATGGGAAAETEASGGGEGSGQAAEEKKLIEEVAAIEKPVDLFKAIFEDSSESDSETGNVKKTGAAADADAAGRSEDQPQEKDKTFGFDKFKRSGDDTVVAAAKGREIGDVEGGIASKGGAGAVDEKKGLDALDPAVRSRVEAALKVLEESKKRKKRKKEKKERKERSKSSKRKKSRKDRKKDRRHKSSSKHKKRRLDNKDYDSTSSYDTDSTDDDTCSTSTDSE